MYSISSTWGGRAMSRQPDIRRNNAFKLLIIPLFGLFASSVAINGFRSRPSHYYWFQPVQIN